MGAEEADFEALKPTPLTKSAGALLTAGGVFTLLLGVQSAGVWIWRGPAMVAIPLMFVLGGANAVCGIALLRLRGFGAAVGGASGSLTALLALGWAVYGVMHGLFSPLSWMIVPLNALGGFLALSAIQRVRTADQARERLRAQGLESGT